MRFVESGARFWERLKRFWMNPAIHCTGRVLAFLLFSLLCASGVALAQSDREVLEIFYAETGGDNWSNSTNWNGGNILETTNLNDLHGITADSDNRVTKINLYGDNLSGTIPTELGSLTGLTRLSISINQLSGTIPGELGNLTSLTQLFLNANDLSGTIPGELGNLTGLEDLYLHANDLSGTIPTELGSLTDLEELTLYGNQLSGRIPTELGSLTDLEELLISINQLSGTIPTELGQLTNLTQLWFNDNQLSGTIPGELGNMTSLTQLYLNHNTILNGVLPEGLMNLSNLTELNIQNTAIGMPNTPEFLAWLESLGDGFTGPPIPPASVTSVSITSDPGSDDTYGIDDSIEATVTFSGKVGVAGTPQLELDIDGFPKQARYESGMGTATLVFSYEVAEGDKAPGGISIEANKLTLNGGTITKSGDSTVDAVLTHSAVGIDSSHKVDGVRPTLVGAVTSTDGTKVILTFSEDLNAAVPTNTPFTVKVGNVSVSLGGTPAVSNLEVTLTLAAAVTTDQAVTVSYADPTSGNDATAVQDTAGNDAESFSYWAVTNAATPRVTSVSITSNPGSDDTYGIDDSIEATVTFSGKVGVTGTLQLELNFNGSPKQARYESGMGTATLVFSYEVAEGDEAPGGISIGVSKLTRNGGTITKSGDSTVDAVLTHSAVGIDSSHKVDGVRPTLVGAVTSTDGTKVILTFSEDLNAAVPTNTPFTVKVGNVSVSLGGAPAVSNLEVTLTLTAAVTTDQAVTVSYADPTSGNDATAVQDTAGNDAESFSYWAVTNAATPRVTSVSITSGPGSDDTYGIEDSIEATVTFSGNVGVTGMPQLELNFNGSPKQAGYESGTGTATLVFSYEVAEGDEAPGGVSIGVSKLTRNGGTITKSGDSTVDAVLTHGAMTIDSAHKVDE